MKEYTVLAGLMVAIALSMVVAGCETQSASTKVFITPSSVTLRARQSAEFTASGGFEYTWSLASDIDGSTAWATLSTRTGPRTTYTSLRSSGTNDVIVKVLTVTSSIPDEEGTNAAAANWTAEAFIYHK